MQSVKSALLASAAILAVSAAAHAQTTPPFPVTEVEIEGRIQSLDGVARTMKVMGVTVHIPPDGNVVISTPTNPDITWDQVWRPDPDGDGINGLPGRVEDGFMDATAIVIGTSNGVTVTATEIELNPEENVALGYITRNSGGRLELDGMPIVLMPPRAGAASFPGNQSVFDPRVPGNPLKNDYGFRITRPSVAPGTPVAAEGWWSEEEGKLFLWDLEVTGGAIANADTPQVSIQRAQCRERDANTIDLEVRGAIHDPLATAGATGNVNIFRPPLNGVRRADYGTEAADPDAGTFGVYDFDARIATTEGCPQQVRAQINVNGQRYNANSQVEIRID